MILIIRAAIDFGFIKGLTLEEPVHPDSAGGTVAQRLLEGDRENIATSDLMNAYLHMWNNFDFSSAVITSNPLHKPTRSLISKFMEVLDPYSGVCMTKSMFVNECEHHFKSKIKMLAHDFGSIQNHLLPWTHKRWTSSSTSKTVGRDHAQ